MTQAKKTNPKTALSKQRPAIGFERCKAEIEKRAKEIYLKRQETKKPGDALTDWLQAEDEIKIKYRIA